MSTKKSPSKPRRPSSKKADAQLVRENKELKFERDGLLEREAATSDILRMIARSPTDLQSVLDGIAERAARLCDAEDAAIFRLDGNFLRLVANFGPIPMADAVGGGRVLDRGSPASRAVIDCQTIHVQDLRAAEAEFPAAKTRGIAMGLRTVLSTPLLREGVAIGAIHVRRREVRPFSDRQPKAKPSGRKGSPFRDALVIGRSLRRRCCARGRPSGPLLFAAGRSVPSRTNRSS